MNISVIIHTYCRYECLAALLTRLTAQTRQPFEVVVVDQTRDEERPRGFYERYTALPVKLINLTQPSHAPANNIGAQAASGDFLIFLDDDMSIRNDWLESFENVLEERRADVVYGAVSDCPEMPETSGRNPARMDPVSLFLKSPKHRWEGMTLVTHGGNTCIRKSVFQDVGGYDEIIPRMSDIELGYRLYCYGAFMLFSLKPFAHHLRWKTGGTRSTSRNRILTRLTARLYIHFKHFPGWTTTQYILFEICNALRFRELTTGRSFPLWTIAPWKPLADIFTLGVAIVKAKRLLRGSR